MTWIYLESDDVANKVFHTDIFSIDFVLMTI